MDRYRCALASTFAGLMLAGCGGWGEHEVKQTQATQTGGHRWTIKAGTVEATTVRSGSGAILETRLAGTFEIGPDIPAAPPPIETDGYAGACLVTRMGPENCTSNDVCSAGLPQGWSGYCIRPHGQTSHPNKRDCWVRPGSDADFCNKRPPPPFGVAGVTFPAGVHEINAAHGNQITAATGGPRRWSIIACLNGRDLVSAPNGNLVPPCAVEGAADKKVMSYGIPGS